VVGDQPLVPADVLEVGGCPGGEQFCGLRVQRDIPVVAELAQRDAQPVPGADENTVTRSVRSLLTGLGYILHSPAELYGSREAALGARDEDWLAQVGLRQWTVLGRDMKIYERPSELAAYRASRLQVSLLPG
jgi:hypothetical protein